MENFGHWGRQHRRRKRNMRMGCCNGNALTRAKINKEYIIENVETNNDEIENFLFTLGCYRGERITIISILSEQYVVVVKDARYSIDKNLARCILVKEMDS